MRGAYTPQVQEAVARLGSRLPYAEAQEELAMMWGIDISVASVRQITMRAGRIADHLIEKEMKRLQKEAPAAKATPKQLVLSADGAMVQLKNGEWREIKTVAFGEFETKWDPKRQEVVTWTEKVSYFSSADKAEPFSNKAIVEWHRRGGEHAEKVVAVNDGAVWIQAFIDYHCPTAIRVIDFAHAQGYVATVGKALYGESLQQKELRASYDISHGHVVIVAHMEIDPDWRGASNGLLATELVLGELGRAADAAALFPMKPGLDDFAERDASARALADYWGRIGFAEFNGIMAMPLPLAGT